MMMNRTAILAMLLTGVMLAGCDQNEEAEPAGEEETVQEAPDPDADAAVEVAPGRYASETMVLALNPNGTFSLTSHGEVEGVEGSYSISGSVMSLTDASGGDGSLSFPMDCSVAELDTGFELSGDGCGLAGQSFAPAAG